MTRNMVKCQDRGDDAPRSLNTLKLERSMSMSDSHFTLPALPTQDGVEFRHVPDWPGYCAGSDGSVWSCWKRGRYRGIAPNWHTRKLQPGSKGYLLVGLQATGKRRMAKVHQLVLEAFQGPRPPGAESRHLDSVRTNNKLDNLVWGTPTENRRDAVREGRHNLQKLSNAEVRQIRTLAATTDHAVVVKQFGITRSYLRALLRRLWRKDA